MGISGHEGYGGAAGHRTYTSRTSAAEAGRRRLRIPHDGYREPSRWTGSILQVVRVVLASHCGPGPRTAPPACSSSAADRFSARIWASRSSSGSKPYTRGLLALTEILTGPRIVG